MWMLIQHKWYINTAKSSWRAARVYNAAHHNMTPDFCASVSKDNPASVSSNLRSPCRFISETSHFLRAYMHIFTHDDTLKLSKNPPNYKVDRCEFSIKDILIGTWHPAQDYPAQGAQHLGWGSCTQYLHTHKRDMGAKSWHKPPFAFRSLSKQNRVPVQGGTGCRLLHKHNKLGTNSP